MKTHQEGRSALLRALCIALRTRQPLRLREMYDCLRHNLQREPVTVARSFCPQWEHRFFDCLWCICLRNRHLAPEVG